MPTAIEKREARLLRWETYLRRTRHVAFWLGVLVIVMTIVLSAWEVQSAEDVVPQVWLGVFLFASAYDAHLKIRHIESIKFHRESNTP